MPFKDTLHHPYNLPLFLEETFLHTFVLSMCIPCCAEYGHIYTRAYIQMQVASLCRGRVHISIGNEVNCRIWGKKDETGSASHEIPHSMEWLLP